MTYIVINYVLHFGWSLNLAVAEFCDTVLVSLESGENKQESYREQPD